MERNGRMTTARRLTVAVIGLMTLLGMMGCAGVSGGRAAGPVSRSIAAARDAGLYAPQPLNGVGHTGGLFGKRNTTTPPGRVNLTARTPRPAPNLLGNAGGSLTRDSELVNLNRWRRPGGQASRYFPDLDRNPDADVIDEEKLELERRLAKLEAELRRVRIFGADALAKGSPLTASHSQPNRDSLTAQPPHPGHLSNEPNELPVALALKLPQTRRDDVRRASGERVQHQHPPDHR